MTLNLEQIRHTADRVAASQGLDVVEIEHLGGGKHRVVRVFIEKNREERARKAAEAESNLEALPAQAAQDRGALDRLAWVTHEDCERFSRDFGTVLDIENLIPGGSYTLEVSSPGLDRKLVTPADFERFEGSVVKVRTFAPLEGNRHWLGKIVRVKGGQLVLDPGATGKRSGRRGVAAGQVLEIPLAEIEKANLVPEF